MNIRVVPSLRQLRLLATTGWVAASLLPATTWAQDEADETEVFELSPFVIQSTDDDGYRAATSVSGTSLNTRLQDLPMSIQPITADFINDTGATDFDSALAYSSGVFTDSREASRGTSGPNANRSSSSSERSASASARGARFANIVNIRGFDVPFQNRYGFRSGGLVIDPGGDATALGGLLDSVNIERMEVVKGPNSLLYGVGVLSGIVNVIPKRPMLEEAYEFSLGVGSYDYFRTTGDVTGPIFQNDDHSLAYRILGAYQSNATWTDWRQDEDEYLAGQLEYRWKNKLTVFGEVQYGKTRQEGIGSQWIYDDLSDSNDDLWRNYYDEQHNYARETGTIGELAPIDYSSGNPLHSTLDQNARGIQGGGLDSSTRLTGPDTWAEREEMNYLLDVTLTPFEGFTFSVGTYYTETDTEEFTVDARIENNQISSININQILDRDVPGVSDLVYSRLNPAAGNRTNRNLSSNYDDLKLGAYYWTYEPTHSESFQWRARTVYDFDTPFLFDTEARHTFLLGYHYIKDKVDYVEGNEEAFIAWNPEDPANDALHFFAPDDYSVLRYNGEQVALAGDSYNNTEIFFHGFYGIYHGRFFDDRVGLIAGVRHDIYNAKTAQYARVPIWDGAGNPPEGSDYVTREQLATGRWSEAGFRYIDNPTNKTYGLGSYIDSFDEDVEETTKTFAANYRLLTGLTVYALYSEGIAPNTGLIDGNSKTIPAESTESREIGIKWEILENKLTGSLAVYNIKRENAIWYFTHAPAPNRWEGVPDELRPPGFGGNSGTEFDPTPNDDYVLNYGVDSFFITEEDRERITWMQDGVRLLSNTRPDVSGVPASTPYVYQNPDNPREFLPATGLYRIEDQSGGSASDRRTVYFFKYDDLDAGGLRPIMERAFNATQYSSDIPGSFDPIRYVRTPAGTSNNNTAGNNPSASRSTGANVTFEDEATGWDLSLIYTPLDNWEIVFNFAHTEREAQGAFNMSDFTDLTTGISYAGTEYDQIVRIFGREAFGITSNDTDGDGVPDQFLDQNGNEISQSNPLRPSEATGGIDGLSLFFQSEDTARLWTKYTFTEGPLQRLGIGFGAKWNGPAQTSIPIGGNSLGANRFATPEAPERWEFEMGVYYGFTWNDTKWNLRLNVFNLLDDTYDSAQVRYIDDLTGRGEVNKRYEQYYAPRTFRLTASVSF
ncbi:MAG: TonB-dependent receptor plug domain-containing protein [Verrucomicrobiota bacterium JB022]|nr:TonB-dependent receptor plug domain-containing protein [Verrucomicrobiota bacterium JB022]